MRAGSFSLCVGEDKPLTSEEIVYIPDLLKPGQIRGVSRVGAMKENLSLAKALESYAATFFGSGTTLHGVIEYPGALTLEQAENLRTHPLTTLIRVGGSLVGPASCLVGHRSKQPKRILRSLKRLRHAGWLWRMWRGFSVSLLTC